MLFFFMWNLNCHFTAIRAKFCVIHKLCSTILTILHYLFSPRVRKYIANPTHTKAYFFQQYYNISFVICQIKVKKIERFELSLKPSYFYANLSYCDFAVSFPPFRGMVRYVRYAEKTLYLLFLLVDSVFY